MCGIAGALVVDQVLDNHAVQKAVFRMCEHMRMRGPDANGIWTDSESSVTLGHRRLSILDLSSRANQPMVSEDGRYVIVLNGEIYNFRELRRELEKSGSVFRTNSDTEVLLTLFGAEQEKMLSRLRGMFAFAIWDCTTRSLFLARDPYGIKPLYFSPLGKGWIFASQVKALIETGLVAKEPDVVGQMNFWLLGSVTEPRTWYRDISALPAGSWCRINSGGHLDGPNVYWDIGDAWRCAQTVEESDPDTREIIRESLLNAVKSHLVSDVPVGVFLSGGIDSGALAGLMRQSGANDIQGVTIAFTEFSGQREDEAPIAAETARCYGITHHVRTVSREEFEADLPSILEAMDQPSIDGVNTWYASKAASELGLKVVVSGVGGDELFQGYDIFRELPTLVRRWRLIKGVPGAETIAKVVLDWQARRTGNLRWRLLPTLANSIQGAWFLRRGLFSPEELNDVMDEEALDDVLGSFDAETVVENMTGSLPLSPRMALGQIESMSYLRNQLLRDSDWASMAHSVELRTPLVDAWLLRDISGLMSQFHRFPDKRLIAEAPVPPLSENVIARRKTGFSIPVSDWLDPGVSDSGRHPTRSWARRLAMAYGR